MRGFCKAPHVHWSCAVCRGVHKRQLTCTPTRKDTSHLTAAKLPNIRYTHVLSALPLSVR